MSIFEIFTYYISLKSSFALSFTAIRILQLLLRGPKWVYIFFCLRTVQSKMLSMCVLLIGVLQPLVLLVSAQGSIVGQQCNTPNNGPGRCNSIHNCPILYELLNEQGRAASDYMRRSLCALENNTPILCCPTGETNSGGNNELTTTQYDPLLPPHDGFSNETHIRVIQPIPPTLGSIVGEQCNTPNNQPGRCYTINNCPVLYELLNQQEGQVSDYVRRSLCAFENRIPILCCPTGEVYSGRNNKLTTTPYGPLLPPFCGNVRTAVRIVVGGTPSRFGAWPWIAALGYRSKNNSSKPLWRCGGSLISARHVLTAAHCAVVESLYMVRIADYDLESDDEGTRPIDVDIERKIVHPGFRKKQYVNDIAVLRLAQDVSFSTIIYPICLPLDESFKNTNFTGVSATVTGWGATSDNASVNSSFAHSDYLQEADVPVVSNAECQQTLSQFGAVIDNRVLCAGFAQGGKDACMGDSGGPLMIEVEHFSDQNSHYQIGVVSYGHGCARPGYPGVYARVTEFLDFILEALQ